MEDQVPMRLNHEKDNERPLSSYEVTLEIQKEPTEKAELVSTENEDGKDVSPSVEIGDANHEVEAAKQQTVAGEPGDVENQNNECTNDVTQTGGADAEHIIEVATDEPPDQNVVSPVPQEHPDPEPCGEDATLSVPDDLPVASSQKEESEALRSPNMDFPPPPPQEEDEPVVSSPDQEVISAAASSGRDSQLDEELHPGPLPDISSGMVDTDPSQAEHDPADTPPSDHNPMPEPTADPAVALDVEIPAPETPDDETTQDDDAQKSADDTNVDAVAEPQPADNQPQVSPATETQQQDADGSSTDPQPAGIQSESDPPVDTQQEPDAEPQPAEVQPVADLASETQQDVPNDASAETQATETQPPPEPIAETQQQQPDSADATTPSSQLQDEIENTNTPPPATHEQPQVQETVSNQETEDSQNQPQAETQIQGAALTAEAVDSAAGQPMASEQVTATQDTSEGQDAPAQDSTVVTAEQVQNEVTNDVQDTKEAPPATIEVENAPDKPDEPPPTTEAAETPAVTSQEVQKNEEPVAAKDEGERRAGSAMTPDTELADVPLEEGAKAEQPPAEEEPIEAPEKAKKGCCVIL